MRRCFVAKGHDWSSFLGWLAGGLVGIFVLNKIANDPRISPLWRKVAKTAEGDLYQHIISGAVVTVFA
jgi:hypothetical protein